MALREGSSRRGKGIPGSSLVSAWPLAVSMLGGWLRQQSRRPGPVGDVAQLAVVVVNRSAGLVCEVSAEVARATAREGASKVAPTTVRHRPASRKGRPKPGSSKRPKPAD